MDLHLFVFISHIFPPNDLLLSLKTQSGKRVRKLPNENENLILQLDPVEGVRRYIHSAGVNVNSVNEAEIPADHLK